MQNPDFLCKARVLNKLSSIKSFRVAAEADRPLHLTFASAERLSLQTGLLVQSHAPYTEWADVARGTARPKVNPRLGEPGTAQADSPSLPALTLR